MDTAYIGLNPSWQVEKLRIMAPERDLLVEEDGDSDEVVNVPQRSLLRSSKVILIAAFILGLSIGGVGAHLMGKYAVDTADSTTDVPDFIEEKHGSHGRGSHGRGSHGKRGSHGRGSHGRGSHGKRGSHGRGSHGKRGSHGRGSHGGYSLDEPPAPAPAPPPPPPPAPPVYADR